MKLLSVRSSWQYPPQSNAILLKNIPEIQQMFNHLGVEVVRLAFFITPPNHLVGKIHFDNAMPHLPLRARVNIPIENCDDSTTRIYEVKPDYKRIPMKQPNGAPFNRVMPDQCSEVDSFVLTRPVVWRADMAHSVSQPLGATRFRISATLFFSTNIDHLLEFK